MVADPAVLKERTRLAQQKSRAKRKRNIENIRLRNEYLTSAVSELVENGLEFSDAVFDAVRGSQDEILQLRLKLFIEKTLSIAHQALDDDDEADEGAKIQSSAKETTSDNEETPKPPALPKPAILALKNTPTTLNPGRPHRGMPYGLLPSLSGCSTPPLDTLDNLDPQDFPFAALLFWNTMACARIALNNPSSPLTRKMFSYAMPFTTAERQRNQISRRLSFRPTGVRLVWPLPGSVLLTEEGQEEVDLKGEEERMKGDFESIEKAMRANGDGMEEYLDAAEVEARLRGYWAIEVGEDLVGRMLGTLILASKCIGNKPGWRRDVVDTMAMEMVAGQTVVWAGDMD